MPRSAPVINIAVPSMLMSCPSACDGWLSGSSDPLCRKDVGAVRLPCETDVAQVFTLPGLAGLFGLLSAELSSASRESHRAASDESQSAVSASGAVAPGTAPRGRHGRADQPGVLQDAQMLSTIWRLIGSSRASAEALAAGRAASA